ncbi:type VI secretion system accessory protein TagJ [Pelagibaculum spongiae]|uniref:Virulence protein SciE type n=1 Tax=Pelagibaculum spongiae TaxID=2080658 RepID=A0A2V1GVJ2_9GAMM|nr:type VI secretion system accessory protein TagJ [Pelagibaculum spongiae]PVZ67687.1 virulence protein SciE type [Pelagibaculum spongiae]
MKASSEQLIKQGKLTEVIQYQVDAVKHQPDIAKERIFLFQLYCLSGQWKKALVHLNASAKLEPLALAMAQAYRECIGCEIFRAEVFLGKRKPLILGEPPHWISGVIEALSEKDPDKASSMRRVAFENAEASSGKINEIDFEWIADADSRIGPVLEVMVNGKYFWLPFSHIKEIQIDAPEDLRDFVWMPARFVLISGGELMGFIPSRYPDSENNQDELVRLARKTVWESFGDNEFFGFGARQLVTNSQEISLFETRNITINLDYEKSQLDSEKNSADVQPDD